MELWKATRFRIFALKWNMGNKVFLPNKFRIFYQYRNNNIVEGEQ